MPDDPNILTLENVRLSFPSLFTAKAMAPGQEPKFSANFILDNDEHSKLLDKIENAIARVKLDFFKKDVKLKHCCLRDGNEFDDKEGYGDGVMFIVASRKTPPQVVNRRVERIEEVDGIIYAGCYVNATIRLFAYDHATGGKGISAELRAVQFVKDGDSFGAGKVDPEKEFKKLDDGDSGDTGSSRRRSPGRSSGGGKASSVDDY